MLDKIAMYEPQKQHEPSGCMEALFYTRIVLSMLFVPFAMILGTVFTVLLAIVALSYHPLLALLVLIACFGGIFGLARWEQRRIAREMPPEDR